MARPPQMGRVLALAVALCAPGAVPAQEPLVLASCEVPDHARSVKAAARELADFLAGGYSESYPAAVALGRSMAEIAAVLERQIAATEPARRSFSEAWKTFDRAVRRSPLPRDPALRQILPTYQHSAGELEVLLGCPAEAAAEDGLVPCAAIPIAHLLAVLGSQMDEYISARGYGESYPEAAAATAELARSATTLHQVLHDLEIAVPGTLGSFETLVDSLDGSSLTDTDEPEDRAVKTRVAALGDAVAALDGSVTSCHDAAAAVAPEAHDHR